MSWSLPEADNKSANKFATQRTLLLLHEKCFEFPHLIGGTTLTIRRASQDFYRYPDELFDDALHVEWRFLASGCANVSCQGVYPPGKMCTERDQPFGLLTGANLYTRVADYRSENVMNVCQPACHNLKARRAGAATASAILLKNDDNAVPPTLVWNETAGQCQYDTSPEATRFLVDPVARLSDNYSPLRDDVVFSASRQQLATFPEILTTVGRVDESYCRQFQMSLEKDTDSASLDPHFVNRKCALSEAESIVSWITGRSLIQLYKLGSDELGHLVERAIDLRSSDIQKYPTTEQRFANADVWRAQLPRPKQTPIPVDVKLSTLGLFGVHEWDEWTNDPKAIQEAGGITDAWGGVIVGRPKKRVKRLATATTPINVVPMTATGETTATTTAFNIEKFVTGIVKILSDPTTYGAIAAGVGASHFVTVLRAHVKQTMSLLADIITKKGLQAAFGFGTETVMAVRIIEYVSLRSVLSVSLLSATASVLRATASLAATSLNVLSWLLIIGPLLDLFFAFVADPLKLNTPSFTDYQLQTLAEADAENRSRSGVLFGSYEPADMMYRYLTGGDTTFTTRHLSTSLIYTTLYCTNLRVDSNGTTINWNDYGDVSSDSVNDVDGVERAFQMLSVLSSAHSSVDEVLFNRRYDARAQRAQQTSHRFIGFSVLTALIVAIAAVIGVTQLSSSILVWSTFGLLGLLSASGLWSAYQTAFAS